MFDEISNYCCIKLRSFFLIITHQVPLKLEVGVRGFLGFFQRNLTFVFQRRVTALAAFEADLLHGMFHLYFNSGKFEISLSIILLLFTSGWAFKPRECPMLRLVRVGTPW